MPNIEPILIAGGGIGGLAGPPRVSGHTTDRSVCNGSMAAPASLKAPVQ